MSSNRERLFIAAFLTLVAGLLVAAHLWRPQPTPILAIAALALLVPLLYLLVRSAREDLDSVLLWLAGILLSAALVVGTYTLAAYQPGPNPKIAALLTGISGLAALAWTLIRQFGPESPDFPDLLAELEPRGKRYETNRVRYDVSVQPGDETHPHLLLITLQNCCDAGRRVAFAIRGPILRKVHFAFPAEFDLGPAEVRQVRLPVVTTEKPGRTAIKVVIAIAGEKGRRLRLRRSWMNVRGGRPPVGVVYLRLAPLREALWNAELRAEAPKLLWQPRPGTLD